jgi:HEAT repeat protein
LGSEYEEHLHRDLLLAGECLADDLRVQPQAAQYILNRLLSLASQPGAGLAIQTTFHAMQETGYIQHVRAGLRTQLKSEGKDNWVRYRLATTSAILGDTAAVDILLALLDEGNRMERDNIVWALRNVNDERTVDALLKCLNDEEMSIRARAAWILGEVGDRRATEPLRRGLNDRSDWVRVMCARALERMGDKQAFQKALEIEMPDGTQALDEIVDYLQDCNQNVRWRAVEALGELGDAQVVERLLPLVYDESEKVRWAVAWALGMLGGDDSIEGLLLLLKDENQLVRASAVRALRKVGDAQSIPELLDLLDDEDREVRQRAVESLGLIGEMSVESYLMVCLEDVNEDRWVRGSAHIALTNILSRNAPEPELEDAPCEPLTVPGPWDH